MDGENKYLEQAQQESCGGSFGPIVEGADAFASSGIKADILKSRRLSSINKLEAEYELAKKIVDLTAEAIEKNPRIDTYLVRRLSELMLGN